MKKFIPVSKPSITEKEIDYVSDAVRSTWVSSLGKYLEEFEKGFAEFCGTKHAVAVFNGTVAIHLALECLGIGEGDEVIVPDFSFIATANAVLYSRAKPVFVDIDPFHLCIDPDKVEAAITPRTKAIMPVHIYGHPADMVRINAIAKKYGLFVIEDAAEAHGASIKGKRVGSWGDCGTFSFYGNKNMTTGEGGMITTNDDALNLKCRTLRDHAMSKEKRYWHETLGYNYRMTNLQAALGVAQVERAEEMMANRKRIFKQYHHHLNGIEGLRINRTADWADHAYWMICAEFEGFSLEKRDALMLALKEKGIDSRPYFYPMSTMPYINEDADTPVTKKIFQEGINLPTFNDLTNDDIAFICSELKKLIPVQAI